MKTKLLTICFLLTSMFAGAQQKITVYQDCARNGAPDNQTGQAPANVEMVDLGLSVKWANMNVGATAPEEYGLYFAWGETQGYTSDTPDGRSFDWGSYKWCNGSFDNMTKYCTEGRYGHNGFTDNKTTLEPADDAATANWGGDWRMPTDDEWTELRTQCTWRRITQNGVIGYRVSASNGNSIFLPAVFYHFNTNLILVAAYGYYWSSSIDTLDPHVAFLLYFDLTDVSRLYDYRWTGRSVRPVCPSLTPKTYTITFANYDGVTLQESELEVGVIPTYSGSEPTKAEDSNYTYTFSGWSPTIAHVTGDATYTAQFAATPKPSAPAGVEMVDLGLSVKWANMNVGATAPEEYGLYFAWGETQGYTSDFNDGRSFDWVDYKWCNDSEGGITKYCVQSEYGDNGFTDNKTTLEPEDDAATANWGSEWRMPTDAEWTELRENCTWTLTQVNDMEGYRVSASNGNSIFLPAAGHRSGRNLSNGSYYWSSSLTEDLSRSAWTVYLQTHDDEVTRYYGGYRIAGLPVRPVRP